MGGLFLSLGERIDSVTTQRASNSDFGDCLGAVDELYRSATRRGAARRTGDLLCSLFDGPTVRIWVAGDDGWTPVDDSRPPGDPAGPSRRLSASSSLTETTLDSRPNGEPTTELLVPVADRVTIEVTTHAPDGFDDEAVALVETVADHLERATTDVDGSSNAGRGEIQTDDTERGETQTGDGSRYSRATVDAGAVRRLHEAAVDDGSSNETVERLLSLGCEYVGLDTGRLVRADGTDCEVVAAVGPANGHEAGDGSELAATDTARGSLGAPVTVGDETYGGVDFSATTPRDDPLAPDEREFVALLADCVGYEIERRRRIEELERYETILEAVGDPVYALDADGQFDYINEAARREFGYGQEAVGESPSIGMDETDIVRVREQIRELLASDDRSTTAEFELQTADGDRTIVENRIASIGNDEFQGTAGVLRDVTERTVRRRQLESFQRAVEEASDGVAILDDGEYVYADETHAEMYGFDDRTELLGESWRVLYDDGEADRIETEIMPLLAESGEWQGMVTGSRPDGSTFPAELSLTRLDDGRLVCTVRDETDRLERERRRQATVDVFRQMYEVTTDQSLSRSDKIDALLEAGTEYLGLPYGFLTEIQTGGSDETQTVTHAQGDHEMLQPGASCPLPESYCRKTVERDELVTVTDATADGWRGDPAYERFALESYVGGSIQTGDGVHGTVCFAGPSARDSPLSPTEKSFVDLLRRWIDYEIDREAARVELSEERERLRLLIDSLDEYAFLVLDGDGRIRQWNTGAESLFGYDPDTATGMPVAELLTDDRRELTRRLLQQARVAGESSDEGWYVRADGSEFCADVRYASLEDDDDTFRGYAVVARDLTDRRRQRRRTERFVEESEDVVTILDTDGRVTYASGSAERVLGYEPETLVDENLFDYLHPDDREPTMESFYTAVDGGEVEVECRLRVADDEWHSFQIHCQNMLADDAIDGMLLYLRDVTEKKRQARRFESIFNQTFQFTGLLRPDGTVIEVNEAALEFGGIERDEIVGERFYDVLWWNHSQTTYDRVRDAVDRASDGEFVRYETEVRGADGLATIDFSLKPVHDDDGDVVLLVAEGRDVTAQRRRRQHLEVVQRVLRHNIRNDLSKIRGWAELIVEAPDRETRRDRFERVARVLDQWRSTTDRVKEIRQVLQVEPGEWPETRLDELVVDAVEAVRDRHPSVTADVELQADPTAVPTNVGSAVRELLENAADTADDCSVDVTVTTPEGGWIEIAVSDDGPGMPAMEAEVLETGEETPLTHGQGLGLWMVRMIVTQAGGDIAVETGEGTRVTLRLPTEFHGRLATPRSPD